MTISIEQLNEEKALLQSSLADAWEAYLKLGDFIRGRKNDPQFRDMNYNYEQGHASMREMLKEGKRLYD